MDGVDPRLQGPPKSQSYSNPPPPQYPQFPIKLPPPPPQQQYYQQPNQQQHVFGPPLGPQDGANEYHQRLPNALPTRIFPHGKNTAPPVSNGQATTGDTKRPRACDACRGLKVRCEFDKGSRDCRRCIKAARQCQTTQPSRKRQKKTDTKVAELERKLENLRSELVAKGNLLLGVDVEPNSYEEGDKLPLSTLDSRNPDKVAHVSSTEGEGRHHMLLRHSDGGPLQQQSFYASGPALETRKRRMSSNAEEEHSYLRQQQTSSPVSFHKPQAFGPYQSQATASPSPSAPSNIHPFLMAQAAYSNATEGAVHDHPEFKMGFGDIVEQHLPRHETAYAAFHQYVHNVAPQTPIIVFQPGVNPEHVRKTKPILFLAIVAIAHEGDAKPSLINGVKEILAQEVMIENKHSVELIQAMLIMSLFYWPEKETANNIYINLASAMTLDTGLGHGACEQHFSTWASENCHLSPSELIEGARTNLGCYAVGKNTYIGSRFQWWHKFGLTEEPSLRLLDTSTDALASDKLLCHWLRMERLADRLYWHSLQGDVLQILPDIEQGMEKCLEQMNAHGVPHTFMMLYHAINLFIYQLTASKTKATGGDDFMDARLASIHGLLEYFLKLTPSEVFNLPVFHFTRVAYALFAMFRVSKTVSNDKLQLPLYLDGVLDLLRESARRGPNEALHWHLVVVAALHDWMHKSSLHALSDVATGESKIVNPPQDAKKAFHMVTADSGEYKIVENEQAFLKVLEETAGRIRM